MNKFTKRYPRAKVIKTEKGKHIAHIIRHPGESANDRNVVAVALAHERHLIHNLAAYEVDRHRGEQP